MHSRTTAREIIEDFKGDEARLLGHRLRHRRHAEGRGARAGEGDAEHQDRRLRAGGRADAGQRRPASSATRTVRRRRRIPRSSRIRCRAGRPISSRSSRPMRWTAACCTRSCASPAPDALRCSKDLAQKEGIFVGITAGATFAGALAGLRRRAEGCEHPGDAAGHRRALSQHAAVRRRPGGHDRGRAGNLQVHADGPDAAAHVTDCGEADGLPLPFAGRGSRLIGPRRQTGSAPTRTSILPKLRPPRMPANASGAFSSPSCTSSR